MAELTERIVRQNPWWEGRQIETVKGMEKRELFSEILGYVDKKQILAVLGLRRVGKTVLILQLIEHLLKTVNPRQIMYFSFDELLAKEPEIIEDVLFAYENEILKRELKDVYIFLDEINYIRDWQVVLKRFYDMDRKIKFIVTGSSGIQIRKAKESLAGRIYEFELKPLRFREFLTLRKIDFKEPALHSLAIKRELMEYLMKGGFPEMINESDFAKAKKYVSGIAEKIIFSDIPKVYDVGNPEILREIFLMIAKKPGSIIEYKKIAETLKITYQTVSKYIHYLEESYLIKSLYNFRGSPVATARKSKKIYLSSTSLILFALDFEQDFISIMPAIAENAVVSHLDAKYFWREYFELDVLHDKIPIEVKYGELDIKNNIHAVKKLRLKRLLVITKDVEKKEQRENIAIQFVPLWKFLLQD